MNQNPNDPKNPDTESAAWEEAMSRDFDARVRDLHEAPLDFTSVKGKATKIRRNRRAAVASGILGVAAIVTPIAVLANDGGDTRSREPDFAPQVTETATDPSDAVDYIAGRTWHQADGDEVDLPKGDYYEAAVWDGQLVTLQPWGEVYSKMVIFDDKGDVADEEEDVVGFAVSSDESILAYTADGDLHTRWHGGSSVLATDVTDTGGGESVGGAPTSVVGTAPCEPESGSCLVRINTDTAGCRGIGSSDVPLPTPEQALRCFDEQDGLLSYRTSIDDFNAVCSGIFKDDGLAWDTCDYEVQDISPSGTHVVGAPSQYDGYGYTSISVLDVETGEETGRFAPEGGFIWSETAWTTDDRLMFSAYDGAQWHLFAMDVRGALEELVDPVAGGPVQNPFLLIRH